jgi:hypothetical protein
MSDAPAVPAGYELPVNSPEVPVDSGVVATPKAFVHGLTMELTESQSQQALQIVLPIKNKWSAIFRSRLRHQNFTVEEAMKLVDQFEDELVTTLAERMSLIATVDASPVFEGEPLIVDFVGCLDDHDTAQYGFDHEKARYEIQKSMERGESFYGEKEPINNRAKQRDRKSRQKSKVAIKPL